MSTIENQATHNAAQIMHQRVSVTKYWPIAVAIGVILCLAGLFLTLAAHQVFGVNAISDLGVWGQFIGYSGLGMGVIITLVGMAVGRINYRYKKIQPAVNTLHLIDVADMRSDSAFKLEDNELLAVNDPSRQEITIYCNEKCLEDNSYDVSSKTYIYGNTAPPLEALGNWCSNNIDFVDGKYFIGRCLTTINDLNGRERRYH